MFFSASKLEKHRSLTSSHQAKTVPVQCEAKATDEPCRRRGDDYNEQRRRVSVCRC